VKIIFLCGSLEEGRDGVGDYTRTLASAMAKSGHSILCVALNDPYISQKVCHVNLHFTNFTSIPSAIRYSNVSTWSSKIDSLNNLTKIFQPDWVSLQYVPYSFSRFGIPIRFIFNLVKLKATWKWHIMFHELWRSGHENIKAFIISLLQKILVKSFAMFLQSSIVHTSIDHYVSLLRGINISASILPIHSNISVPQKRVPDKINSLRWIFIFFGSFDSKWQSEPLFKYIDEARESAGISECIFWRVGRSSLLGNYIWTQISCAEARLRYPAFRFIEHGEQSEASVSRLLLKASFGISMAPLQWIGKSGSVAAMIAHGLPVIVPTYSVSIEAPPLESIFFWKNMLSIDPLLPARLQKAAKFSLFNSVDQTASLLASSLSLK